MPAAPTSGLTLPPVSLPPPEGFEWDLIELDPALFSLGASIRDVTHTGSIYIAVGYDSDDCGRIWLSDDGSGWELAPLQPSESGPCVPLFSKVAAAGDPSSMPPIRIVNAGWINSRLMPTDPNRSIVDIDFSGPGAVENKGRSL